MKRSDLDRLPEHARREALRQMGGVRPEIAALCAAAEKVLKPNRRKGPTPEGRVKTACINYLKAHGWTVHRLNVVDRPLGGGGWMKQGTPGDPDLLALRPYQYEEYRLPGLCHALYVECKAGKNPVSPVQLARHEELREATGAKVIVVRDNIAAMLRELEQPNG